MPPDRGAVKKSPYGTKEPNSTPQKKKAKQDFKEPHSKYESGRDKEPKKTRDLSASRTTKERSQKEDLKARSSVREKLAILKSESEKTKGSVKDVKQDRVRPRESQPSSHVTKETNSKNIKPGSVKSQTPVRNLTTGDAAPHSTQMLYRTSRTTEKPKINSTSKGNLKKNTVTPLGAQTRRSISRHQVNTQKDVAKTEKLPNKMKHPEGREQNRNQGRQTERVNEPNRLGRDRTRTRTLSPQEVKVAKSYTEGGTVESEKLREDQKYLAENVAAISAAATEASGSQSLVQASSDKHREPQDDDGGCEYEDDFEDYESDFEDSADSDVSDEGADIGNYDSSSNGDSESELVELTPRQHPFGEEEKKLDSGNYDLAEQRRKGREMQEIKMALGRENETLSAQERMKSHVVDARLLPTDEGYVEGKADDQKHFSTTVTPLNFINFANARKRKQEKMANATTKKRGEKLLDMIQLDTVSFTLFELSPVPYEVYMKSYGCSNTLQAHVQTNEDNLSEEVQTDEIRYKNKWTQKPVSFQTKNVKSSVDEVTIFSQDHLGVGGDSVEDDTDSWKERLNIDTLRLSQFLSSAGQVVSVLLEEGETVNANKFDRNMKDIPFSDGYISLGLASVPFLADRPVTIIRFPRHRSNLLLTVHKNVIFEDRQTEHFSPCRSMIAIWSILEPSLPQKILVAAHEITASCFNATTANVVFAGQEDGSLCVWDLREKSHYHKKVETEHGEWVLRSPTYNTAAILKDKGHLSKVVALQPLVGTEVESDIHEKTEVSPTQICSLDEGGKIIIWTVIQSYKQDHQKGILHQDLGLAHWGRVRLVCSSAFSLMDTISLDHHLCFNLMCFDLQLDGRDHDHLYIGTNTGYVVHSLKNGGKPRPQFYVPNWGEFTDVKCIEPCPFGEPYFIIGCGDGTVRLHSQTSEKPLATMAGTGDPISEGPSVVSLQWSRSKPLIFFVLDSSSRIHIWDFSKSDIRPVHTLSLGTVTAIQLSAEIGVAKTSPHLALATGPGQVEIHRLRQEFYSQTSDEVNRELEKFMQYMSIL
ncbi:WD repeat-containing protein 60 isoform X2 [Zootermopsis nevadensis]|uniref:WD repeat-containing protein 60 n=1 Tax=Zootermopsis nevadensis TaxID=136037 RepID=A0A067RN08_ZOONE|nr:WD repeat-containing protein 60 isoform X2 [Zootermopsis nevadensis]KDR24443.1 WD repeat-containing protein 60 [Zootermopsis nevadensis]